MPRKFEIPPFCLIVAESSMPYAARGTTAATQSLPDNRPCSQAMVRNDRVIALYGVPLAQDRDLAMTTDEFVAAFMTKPANTNDTGGQ